MPRALKFKYGESEFECDLNKIDRRKLYGSVDIETRDIDGERCSLATLANDGKTLIPYGGTALGYINKDGEWVERNDLQPTDLSGEELPLLPSSFDVTIELKQTASLDEFLNFSSRLVYFLGAGSDQESDQGDDLDGALLKELTSGKIFRFDFLYREGISSDPAFLIGIPDGKIWMMVGKPSMIEYVGLDQAAVCFVDKDDEDEEVEEFDFEML